MADDSISKGYSRYLFGADTKIEDARRFYNQYADKYDEELTRDGQTYPGASSVIKTLIDVVGKSSYDMKILDLGAGTGVAGIGLTQQGFTNLDAVDLSQKMLDKAKERGVYKKYICAAVTDEPLDIPTGTYDALVSTGAISVGLIKANAFDEILRLVRHGGYICFTIRKDVYESSEYGYKEKLQNMLDEGKWQEVRKFLCPYYNDAVEVQKECYVFCYKVINKC